MNNDIVNSLRDIYCVDNRELYVRKCNSRLAFWDEIVKMFEGFADKVTVFDSTGSPTEKIHADFNVVHVKGITIKYSSTLYVSKLAGGSYFRHDFHMNNPDKDGLEPFLYSFGGAPYSAKQFYLDEMVNKYLDEKGYLSLCYAEMEEIFPDKIYSSETGQYELKDLSALLFDLPYMQEIRV